MSEKEISELVKAQLEAKIIEAFKSTPDMIDELVSACLTTEVNQHGGKPRYDDEAMPYLTYLARDAVQGVARTAVLEWVKETTPDIKKRVQSKLEDGALVDALTDAILRNTKTAYDISIEFNTKD